MSDELNSQLSAFVDDELTPEESELFVRRLCRDEGLRRKTACYELIGDAIRGETAVTAPADFSARVMMAVEGQTPAASRPQPVEVGGNRLRNWGFALAASVVLAAMALVTLPGGDQDGFDQIMVVSEDTADAGVSSAGESAGPAPVLLSAQQVPGVVDGDSDAPGGLVIGVNAQNVPIVMPVSAERRAQLNNLLLQHLNSSGASRQPGLVGFRNVGFVTQTESKR